MRIKTDGTVFRIELGSSRNAGGIETRISHAVNAQGGLARPRIEVGRHELESFFAAALPHIFGHCLLIGHRPQSIEDEHKIIAGLVRTAEEMAAYCTADKDRRALIPEALLEKVEILNALRNPSGSNWQMDKTILRRAVDALLKRLEEAESAEVE